MVVNLVTDEHTRTDFIPPMGICGELNRQKKILSQTSGTSRHPHHKLALATHHIPVRRVALFACNKPVKPLPKRLKTRAPYAMSSLEGVKDQRRYNSYRIAVNSDQPKIRAEFLTPKIAKHQNKCLPFRPINGLKRTVSCCSKDICFVRPTPQTQNSPPYESCTARHSSRAITKDTTSNPCTTALSVYTEDSSSRQSIIKSLKKKVRKSSSHKTRVSKTSEIVKDRNANSGCIPSKAGTLFVNNAYLRQHEAEIAAKQEDEKDRGYSLGFAPKVTSTPVHKPWVTSDVKVTSGYFSKPSSSEGSSGKNSEVVCETKDAKNLRGKGTVICVENKEKSQESDSAISTSCNGILPKQHKDRPYRKRFFTSTPQQDQTPKTLPSTNRKLPGMYPIGAPSAASSPSILPSFRAKQSIGSTLSVWRP